MMIKVFFKQESKLVFFHKRLFIKAAQETIRYLNIKKDSEINVIITNNDNIQKISKQYKNVDKPTDVLSFNNDWKTLSNIIGYNMLGDIYISYEKVKKQAKEYNHSKKREWTYLFVHGLLHCLGYDHNNKHNEKNMNKIASIIMKKIKVGRHE